MAWFMPSWGRPQRMLELLKAPGGWPDRVVVQVNADDPTLPDYMENIVTLGGPWEIEIHPIGSRCSTIHQRTYPWHPHEAFYGFLMDDLWPMTRRWDELLIDAAEHRYFAIPQGPGYPKRIRTAFVMGGDLVRAMGSVVPIPLHHWCEDCLWDDLAATLNLMRPVKKAIVDHRNFEFGLVPMDATYERGREFIKQDEQLFAAWMKSPERTEMLDRIRLMLEDKWTKPMSPIPHYPGDLSPAVSTAAFELSPPTERL